MYLERFERLKKNYTNALLYIITLYHTYKESIHFLGVKYHEHVIISFDRLTNVNLGNFNCNCIHYKIHAAVFIRTIKESHNMLRQNVGHAETKGTIKPH